METSLKPSKDENVKVLFYSMLPDFRICTALWKVPRPRPFVLYEQHVEDDEYMAHWWDDDDREKLSTWLKSCRRVTSSNTYFTWTKLG